MLKVEVEENDAVGEAVGCGHTLGSYSKWIDMSGAGSTGKEHKVNSKQAKAGRKVLKES